MSQTYYLQCNDAKHDCELRTVIDSRHMDGWTLRAEPIKADSWLHAKSKFGFELSEIQKRLLAEQRAVA